MKNLLPVKKETFSIDMLKNQFVVVDRRGGDAPAKRKSFAKLQTMLGKMPRVKVDTVAQVRKLREGRVHG